MIQKNKNKNLLFFNEAIEYFDKFTTQDILSNENHSENNNNSNFLRDEMLNELDNLKSLIERNPDLKLESLTEAEKQEFQKFIKFYSICPLCGGFNHYFNLKQLFFDQRKKSLIRELIKFMNVKNKKLQMYNVNFGIPCCDCYQKIIDK
ncbi:MAG: hypothetical protein ACFFA0_03350 [Promethearchaeota archaeon]